MSTSPDPLSLSLHLQQALTMLDLTPEQELARYQQSKQGGLNALKTFESAELIDASPSSSPPLTVSFASAGVMTDEDEEDYEIIPPSEPFAIYEEAQAPVSAIKSTNLDTHAPAGEMVLTGQLPESESLNLSLLTPAGQIAPLRDEYLPSSQELWKSLGQTAPPPAEIPIPKWKMPVAIGSSLLAITAVSGMSYVNMHPALLKTVPLVSQLTAAPVLLAVPPGEVLQGPDLAMGEFSDLSLSNINSISIPGPATAQAAAPVAPPSATTPVSPAILPGLPPPQVEIPSVAAASTTHLADGLIRNLLPPNIRQLAGQQATNGTLPTVKPEAANQLYYQPPAATATTSRYSVFAKYVNPLGMAKIQSLLPAATRQGDRVYLGSFADQSAAAVVVKQMQEQGIKTWLVRPRVK
jgi:hypothetical protein